MASDSPLQILQISSRDAGGGAERIAWDLFRTYRSRGHDSRLAVGYKHSADHDVLPMPHHLARPAIRGNLWRVHHHLQPFYRKSRLARGLCRFVHRLAEPEGHRNVQAGVEDFHFPGIHHLFDRLDIRPDVMHLHNLHGQYFDLRVLPNLCRRQPVVITLHDAWMTTGHCAHSFDCERWRTGCGECPDLTIYPAIRRDATADNWRTKRALYADCRLFVATPCRWLMEKVRASMLWPAVAESRVIPHGIDLSIFQPADRGDARRQAGLPADPFIVLCAANGIRRNPWRDFETMRRAVAVAAERMDERSSPQGKHGPTSIHFIALGESAPGERIGRATIQFIPFTSDPHAVARYYQGADVYLHAARADTFPNTVLEALACGTPVVATAVGGIPEQIRSLPAPFSSTPGLLAAKPSPTGILTEGGDAEAMAEAIVLLATQQELRRCLGENAARDAVRRFDLNRLAADYLHWYREILGNQSTGLEPTSNAPEWRSSSSHGTMTTCPTTRSSLNQR